MTAQPYTQDARLLSVLNTLAEGHPALGTAFGGSWPIVADYLRREFAERDERTKAVEAAHSRTLDVLAALEKETRRALLVANANRGQLESYDPAPLSAAAAHLKECGR